MSLFWKCRDEKVHICIKMLEVKVKCQKNEQIQEQHTWVYFITSHLPQKVIHLHKMQGAIKWTLDMFKYFYLQISTHLLLSYSCPIFLKHHLMHFGYLCIRSTFVADPLNHFSKIYILKANAGKILSVNLPLHCPAVSSKVTSSRPLWSWPAGRHMSSLHLQAALMCWVCRKWGYPRQRSPRPGCASSRSPGMKFSGHFLYHTAKMCPTLKGNLRTNLFGLPHLQDGHASNYRVRVFLCCRIHGVVGSNDQCQVSLCGPQTFAHKSDGQTDRKQKALHWPH